MAKRLNSVLGIDIGSQKIKVCEVKTQGKDPVVTALGMIDTPEGSVDHTGVFNSDAVGAALKQVLSSSGASVSQAVVSIAGQSSVLVRTLEVPKMNPAELKEHMQWEINRNIPFSESTVVSDFKPLGNDDPASQNMDVVMAIAPQSAIDTMVACLKKAGKTPVAIDVEPMSMARSLARSYEEDAGKTICFVDMGSKTTSINIYSGSRLLMPRQIPMGGELFTKAIADGLMVPFAEAETIKTTRLSIPPEAGQAQAQPADPFAGGGSAGPTSEFQPYNPFGGDSVAPYDPTVPSFDAPEEPNPFAAPADPPPADLTPAAPVPDSEEMKLYRPIAPVLDEFVAEVRRSIDYFKSRGGDVNLIVLAGGGTKIKGLADYLTAVLSIECDVYDPLRRLTVNSKKVAPGFIEDHKQEFAVAIGNGLHIFFD